MQRDTKTADSPHEVEFSRTFNAQEEADRVGVTLAPMMITISEAPPRGDHPTLPHPVPEVRHELAGVGEQVHYTRHIPRGATALDRDGRRFAVWPDGTHGYTRATRCAPGLSSHSFGPYMIERVGLTVAQCDEAVLG